MRTLIFVLSALIPIAALLIGSGALLSCLFTYPARQRLQQRTRELQQLVVALTRQVSGASHHLRTLQVEHRTAMNLCTTLSQQNSFLLSRINLLMWREMSGSEEPQQPPAQTQPPLADLAAQAPVFTGTPGTTTCLTCGIVLTTPDNRIPGDWLLQHTGHNIHISLDPERYAADHQPVEDFKDGDIIDG